MGSNMLALTRAFGERDLAGLRSEQDAVFFTVLGEMITYPIWLVLPLAGLGIVIIGVLGVLARRRREATLPRLIAGAAAALLPLIVAPLAAIGLWQLLLAIRPGYEAFFLGDPYQPELYRWALGALSATILCGGGVPLCPSWSASAAAGRTRPFLKDGSRCCDVDQPVAPSPTACRSGGRDRDLGRHRARSRSL